MNMEWHVDRKQIGFILDISVFLLFVFVVIVISISNQFLCLSQMIKPLVRELGQIFKFITYTLVILGQRNMKPYQELDVAYF